jgi:ferritin-like metal-binding protein YciE
MYWAENKLVKTLSRLEEAATHSELKQAFSDHLEETRNHVTRLRDVFDLIGETASSQKCPAMAGIIDEGNDIIDETDAGSSQRDVGLIFAGQKGEHYEIATYGGLISLARTLGFGGQVATLLSKTLDEEKRADLRLTQIAETNVNAEASNEPVSV